MPKETITFHFFAKHRLIKKKTCYGVFWTCIFKTNIDVEQKTKNQEKAKIKKGDLKEKEEESNRNEKGLMNKNFVIE